MPTDEEMDLLSSVQSEDALDLTETKERLLVLKKQMEEYERRATELENLKLRRQEVVSGQKTMREKLNRALTVLERAEYDARREVEQVQIARQTFSEHLQQLEEISPSEWPPDEMEEHLGKAISQVDHARAVYNQSRARITALSGQDVETGGVHEDAETGYEEGESFLGMVRRGFAFTLPLIILLGILIAVLLTRVQ